MFLLLDEMGLCLLQVGRLSCVTGMNYVIHITEILIAEEGYYAGIGYSFTVAYLRDLDSSEKSTEHESKNRTESSR